MQHKKGATWLAVTLIGLTVLACNLPQLANSAPGSTQPPGVAEDTQSPSVPTQEIASPTATPIVHITQPGDPPASWESEITDRDSSVTAAQRRGNGGENYSANLFERPFNAGAMDVYYPDLDILRARLGRDSQWVFVTISLQNTGSGGSLGGNYGVEFDLNVDGRGDLLVFASAPGQAWSTDGVGVWVDQNHDVGAAHPTLTDAPSKGDGYETQIFNAGVGSDPDLAWARISPLDPKNVQIALKRSAISDDGAFAWGAWTDAGVFQPGWFDYNDHFTLEEAGSSLTEQTQYYPLKALYELDNTCRWAVGFTPTGAEPGLCAIQTSTITGLVWYDNNDNETMDGPDYGVGGVTVRIRSGSCASPGGVIATLLTNSSGTYSTNVPPGTYCVDIPTLPPVANRGSGAVSVTAPAGGTGRADFRLWYIIF